MTQPRQGCVPLRPLGVAEILDGSFRAIRRNPAAMFAPAAVFAVVRVAATAGLQLGGYRFLNSVALQLLGTFVIGAVLGTVLSGLLAAVVTQDVLGVRITARQALTRLRGRIWALLGLAVVSTVLETLGLIVLAVPGIWLWGLWAVAVPAMVVERTTIRGALARSRQLVTGMWWRVWGIRALAYLLASLLGIVVSVPFLALASAVTGSGGLLTSSASGSPAVYVLIISVGSVLSATLTEPVRAGIDALLYVDLRMRREGLDIVLQQAARAAQPAAPAVSARARSAF
ncbi:MAG: hypothetical protein QOF87_4358 [Pseudonocardiales bacterium]|nr:hypothetical protein [Pseudonocardiales bacterium]